MLTAKFWELSYRADPRAIKLADQHYSRQKPGTPQFVPPGSCLVLLTENTDALWVTSAPIADYTHHAWPGAWICSLFRREPSCPQLASDLIKEAVAVTRWRYGKPPEKGFVTFIDRDKTNPKRDPGYCYLMAGWRKLGRTKGGLYALGLNVEELESIEPKAPHDAHPTLDFHEMDNRFDPRAERCQKHVAKSGEAFLSSKEKDPSMQEHFDFE